MLVVSVSPLEIISLSNFVSSVKMKLNFSFCLFSYFFPFFVTFCLCKELQTEGQNYKLEKLQEHDLRNGWGWTCSSDSLMPEMPPRCLDPKTFTSIDPTTNPFFQKYRLWYYSGGSQAGYMALARILLGRPAQNPEELNQMCPVLAFSFQSRQRPPVFYSGYGAQAQVNCGNDGLCHMSNNPEGYDSQFGTDPFSNYVTLKYYLIATDYKIYMIYYLCTDNVYGDYQILTPTPFVSPEVAAAFLRIKDGFGFSNSTPHLLTCSSPAFDRPYLPPFQNYPHSITNPIFGWSHSHHQSQSHSSSIFNGWTQRTRL